MQISCSFEHTPSSRLFILHYIRHYNKHLECYVIYDIAHMSSLIHTDRRTDTGHDIMASAINQIATKTL